MFVLNVILLFSICFLMIELNYGVSVFDYIVDNVTRILFVVSSTVILTVLTGVYFYFESRRILMDVVKLIEVFVLLDISILISFVVGKYMNLNARPFAFFAMMCVTIVGRKDAVFLNVIYALVSFVIDININLQLDFSASDMWQYCATLLITFCSGTTVIFVLPRIKTRTQNVLIVFLLLIPIELIIGTMEVLLSVGSTSSPNLMLFAYGAFAAVCSVLAYMVVLPFFELVFAELTVFRLRELTSPTAPLIKRLKEEAPGTYNHSVVVAQLAEACANAIGEDGELARAAAYYHDVGKLKNPEMYTENQSDYNLHNELTPELSADIIRSHTRDGAKLIKKRRLPDFFADVAIQHHGTMPIKYFYAKALKMSDGEINIANYSYSGPVPQTKIAAIIMIADASEAASRSLSNRSAENVERLVKGLVEERLDMEQFAECDITMHDLTVIIRTIAQSLSGVYHSRIAYPKLKLSKKN